MLNSESRLGANIAGLLLMAVVAPWVVGLVVALNRLTQPKEEKFSQREVSFTPEARKPKPPPAKEEPPAKAAPRKSGAADRIAISRMPALGPGLTGVQMDLPEFRAEPISALSESVLGDLSDVVHTEASVDRKPALRFKTPIDPPAAAKQKNLAGRVVVNLLIGADGAVKAVRVVESDPPGVFDDCVVQAVREWTFEPALYKSQAVEMWATLPVQFSP